LTSYGRAAARPYKLRTFWDTDEHGSNKLEYWNNGIMGSSIYFSCPIFHDSNFPVFLSAESAESADKPCFSISLDKAEINLAALQAGGLDADPHPVPQAEGPV